MPRFQLLVRELGKTPRVVSLTQTLVVGRSRRADLVLEDEEVGREQFRIGSEGALLFVEGIGKTNRTAVDGTAVEAGQRVTVGVGATIRVGRSTLVVQAGESTESVSGGPRPDATMVAPRPTVGEGTDVLPEAAPMNTIDFGRPGPAGLGGARPGAAPQPPAPPTKAPSPPPPPANAPADDENAGMTINLKGSFRPGGGKAPGGGAPAGKGPAVGPNVGASGPAAGGPGAPSGGDENAGMTMNLPGGFRPNQGAGPGKQAPPPTPLPPAGDNQTIQVSGGYRPGGGGGGAAAVPPPKPARVEPPAPPPPPPAPPRPQPQAASPPPPKPAPPPPAPPPPKATAPAPAPAVPAGDEASPGKPRPKTVYVPTDEMVPSGTNVAPVIAADIEARLHQTMPRVFVKGENIKRRARLMKPRSKVGRAETADVLLPHESVSELHAEIEFDGVTWSLRDCGSTNGTLVDGTVLRGRSMPIARNSLLGFGTLRGLFLCVDPANAARERRQEERALRDLVRSGRLGKDLGREVLAIVKADASESVGDVLLRETAIEPGDWAAAYTNARGSVSFFERLLRLFTRPPKPPAG